ncbi:MAG TPA: hypothetical protein VHL80_10460 [Polyangia bacterium]|nr:hypothetical protein [Polyangia bacterium]
MSTAATRVRPGNLTASLVAFAFLELVLNRLANRLFMPHSALVGADGGSTAARAVAASGPLLFHLTSVLGLIVLLAALVGLLRRGELFPRPMRISVTVIGLSFWMLAANAVVFGALSARLALYLEASFGFLSLLLGAALLGAPLRGRMKLGVLLFVLPGALHVIAHVGDRMGRFADSSTPGEIAHLGELVLLAACVLAPLLLPPRPARERPWRAALLASSFLTGALVVALVVRFDLLQATFLYGLRVDVPRVGSLLGLAYVAAFAGWTYTTVQLLLDKGGMRLAGYGLLLLAIAGYQPSTPIEVELALLGLLALSVGEVRAAPYGEIGHPRVNNAAWRTFIGRLATDAGDGTSPDDSRSEAVFVEEGELEVTRIRAHRRGLPVAMRLLRRRGALVELEATLGETPRSGPDASIERHRSWLSRRPEQRVRLPRTKTGDEAFDGKLSVHGQAPLADAALRARVGRAAATGVVSLWRGTAARYHASGTNGADGPPPFRGEVEGDGPVRAIVAVLDTLADLVEASA